MAENGQDFTPAPLDAKHEKALVRAAGSLQVEARKILRKHEGRLPAEVAQQLLASVAAIDTARAKGDNQAIAVEAQRIDELLSKHAGFARKSSMRETFENIAFAVAVALGLRAALYEPFNIPSGSMFPTLQNGDHIFVNKFLHGIQIPFTTKVLFEDLIAPIERGEVIVFRFPLDHADDYIKRVIGLPGDTLRFQGDNVWLKRVGTDSFALIERQKLNRRCRDEDQPQREINGCDLYEETLDNHVYTVRYMRDPGISYQSEERTIVVPERSYLVLGDNRRRSKDSLMWMVSAPAVSASALLGIKDLRDLSAERDFELVGKGGQSSSNPTSDGSADNVVFRAKHISPGHARDLALWRKPLHGGAATFNALSRVLGESRPLRVATMGGLLQDDLKADSRLIERAKSLGMGIDRLEVGEGSDNFEVLAYMAPVDVVVHLRCGKQACPTTTALGLTLADVLARLHERPQAPASELLSLPNDPVYSLVSDPARTRVSGRFWHTSLAADPQAGPRDSVRAQAVRGAFEGTRVLQEAALAQANSDSKRAHTLSEVPGRNYVVEDAQVWHLVLAQPSQNIFTHVQCGKRWCPDAKTANELALKVAGRLPAAADQGHRLRELLSPADFVGVHELPLPPLAAYPWDHVQASATLATPAYEVSLDVRLNPSEGLAATLARWSAQAKDVQVDASFGPGGFVASDGDGFELGLTRANAALHLRCGRGLCPDVAAARNLAKRVFDNAVEAKNFVDESAMVARPFVPRGNIKGRAEVIWLPPSRFGTSIP